MSDVRTYRAATMQEALDRVRADLGSDAVILASRRIPVRRIVPWGEKEEIEVTAGVGVTTRAAAPLSGRSRIAAAYGLNSQERRAAEIVKELQRRQPDGLLAAAAAPPKPAPGPARPEPPIDAAPVTELSKRLDGIERLLADLNRRRPVGDETDALTQDALAAYDRLIAADVDESLARELASALSQEAPTGPRTTGDPAAARMRLLRAVELQLPCRGPIAPAPGVRKVVSLVGPTGVGKTTTIAKLAANFRLRDGLRVGLVTVDTYRIAAVDQLRAYAQIIDLPMHVVATPEEMTAALERLGDVDVVLIDTAGRSPRDAAQIRELTDLLAAAQPHEVHLVLSLTAGRRSLAQAAARFAPAGPTALVATKLDEADGAGPALALCRDAGLPLSYLTTGQDVPDDIEPVRADRLARWIVNGRRGDSS